MVIATVHEDPIRSGPHLNRSGLVRLVARPQLALLAISPAPQRTTKFSHHRPLFPLSSHYLSPPKDPKLPRLTLLYGDITTARVDALVNAWNRNFIPHWLLIPQGGAGALRRRAGSAPFREVRRAGLLPLGGLVKTGPGRLADVGCILHVAALHATWRSSARAIELSAAAIFRHAADHELDSLAIPLLGSGTGGVDPTDSFRILRDAWRAAPRQ